MKSIYKFNSTKQRGGLKLALNNVFKTVQHTESLFKSLMIEKKQLFVKNISLKIMVYVQNALATSTTMFQECDNCWDTSDLFSRPHKIKIINHITRTYLNIRLHAYSKIMTSSIIKPASKRQKLTKTVLFYNM